MKKGLLAATLGLAAFLFPQDAHAKLGFTYFLSNGGNPTLDWRAGSSLIQLNALDLVDGLIPENGGDSMVNLGLGYYQTTARLKITNDIEGMIMPGAALGLNSAGGDTAFAIQGQARVGAQASGKMGVGVFIVPGVGISTYGGNTNFDISSTLQLSIWSVGK